MSSLRTDYLDALGIDVWVERISAAEEVLPDQRSAVPGADAGDFLPLEEAQRIVDEVVEEAGGRSDEVLYTYLRGHRKRLAHSLSLIPRVTSPEAS